MGLIGLRVTLVLAALAICTSAAAQTADKAAAELLFTEARQLVSEGKYTEACPKFAQSQQLDPATGTLLNLADCYERAGKTASAWMTWLDAATAAKATGQTDRERLARQRSAALQPRLVYLTIKVPDASRIAGISVTRNGEPVREALWDTSVPVDPDRYTVAASAPGRKSWQMEVVVAPGQPPGEVTVPVLDFESGEAGAAGEPAPAPAAPAPAAPAPAQPAPAAAPGPAPAAAAPPPITPAPAQPQTDRGSSGSGLKAAGWILGGVGLVGIGVGSYYGAKAFARNDQSTDHCTGNLCTQQGIDLRDEAKTSGTISTIAIGAGAGLLVTGAVLLVANGASSSRTARRTHPPLSAALGVDRFGGQLVVKGGF